MYTWQVPPSNVSSLSWRMTPPYSLNNCRPTYHKPVIVAIIVSLQTILVNRKTFS